jgi:pimeloyl-ACP methyl ester carboxylesterase
MKRIFSLPAIGLLIAFLLGNMIASFAQSLFTVDVKGSGKPMILIHGLTCSGDVWKETVAHYQDKYECHIITLAGFGGNAPATRDNFLAAVKDDVINYTRTKKLKKPVIIGHSMGAFIALWTAASAPDLFEKVIAVDGVPFMPALQMPGATVESAKPMADNMYKMMSTQTQEQFEANTRMFLGSMITSPQHIDEVMAIAKKADVKTQAKVMYEMMSTDLRETVASIKCPVLLMGAWIAYKNYGVTHESAVAMYTAQVSNVKHATVEITDTGKHFIFYDEPTWFFQKTDAFLL